MTLKVSILILGLTLTLTWLGVSTAQPPATGQVLRVYTVTVLPEKRDQLPQIAANMTQSISAAEGVLWFKVGTDTIKGEVVGVMLWNSQSDLDTFLNSAARNASYERTSPLFQGEPSAKNYQVAETKK